MKNKEMDNNNEGMSTEEIKKILSDASVKEMSLEELKKILGK